MGCSTWRPRRAPSFVSMLCHMATDSLLLATHTLRSFRQQALMSEEEAAPAGLQDWKPLKGFDVYAAGGILIYGRQVEIGITAVHNIPCSGRNWPKGEIHSFIPHRHV